MVTSPTGKGVIVMGGNTAPGQYSKAMFELTQFKRYFWSKLEPIWSQLEQTLKIGHLAPLAIPIPDELVSKQQ